jgi:hypothetical protein
MDMNVIYVGLDVDDTQYMCITAPLPLQLLLITCDSPPRGLRMKFFRQIDACSFHCSFGTNL